MQRMSDKTLKLRKRLRNRMVDGRCIEDNQMIKPMKNLVLFFIEKKVEFTLLSR